MSLAFLQFFGLTKTETALYELLLKKGESTIAQLQTDIKMNRATMYKALYTLEEKNLVTVEDKDKKIHFLAASPDKLLEIADTHFSNLERAKENLQAVFPNLMSSYTLAVEKPIIRMYEGEEGVKKGGLEVLAEKQEILAYVYVDEEIDTRMDDFFSQYYKQRIKDQIHVRAITPNNHAGVSYKARDEEELRLTYLVPIHKFPIGIEKNIVGDKVVFFTKEKNKLIVTVIENKLIADAERAIFELAWKEAERFNQIITKDPLTP